MAYQFADGFDNYGNTYTLTAGYPWDAISGITPITTTADTRFAPPGILPGACVSIAGAVGYLRKNLSGNQGTIIVGVGVKWAALPSSGQGDVVQFYDSGTLQLSLAVNSVGGLQFYRGGSGGTAIGTLAPPSTVTANTWYGLLMQVTIAPGSGGSVQLYINGNSTPTILSTALNTSADGASFANQVAIAPLNLSGATKFDDFYCFDTTGVFANALPSGDLRILTKVASGAGNYTNWTPNGLATNWQNTAVQPPSTADYNANNTPTTKDSYTMPVAGLAVPPVFVVVRASMERDDAGPHTPGLFVRSGSTDSAGVTTPAISSSYVFYDAAFQNDPATVASWTGSGADNAQIGIIEG